MRKVQLKYHRDGHCIPGEPEDSGKDWHRRNPSQFWQKKERDFMAVWMSPSQPTSFVVPNVAQGRRISFEFGKPEKLPDRSLHFPRSWEREKKD